MRNGIAEGARRNAEVVQAMGMAQRIGVRWGEANAGYLAHQQRDLGRGRRLRRPVEGAAHAAAVGGAGGRRLSGHRRPGDRRHHDRQLDPHLARLAPVELAIGNWKGFVGARQGWRRLKTLLAANAAAGGSR